MQPAARRLETPMTKKETKGRASYAGALLICRNLARLTVYEMVGDQILEAGKKAFESLSPDER